jgi:hypothetical protein
VIKREMKLWNLYGGPGAGGWTSRGYVRTAVKEKTRLP